MWWENEFNDNRTVHENVSPSIPPHFSVLVKRLYNPAVILSQWEIVDAGADSLTHSLIHTLSLFLSFACSLALFFSRKDHVVNSDLVVSPAHGFSFPSTHLPGTNYFVQSEQNNDNF